MDRRRWMLAGLDLARMQGVEIGPLTSPIVQRGEGNILYVDHADTETLRRKYLGHAAVDVSQIVEVDAVWGGNSLQQSIGETRKADYVLASHVIEHVPDLLGWLAEVREVLQPGGELRLIIPDRRFTFDRLRQETRLSDVVYAHLVGARAPLAPMILDHILEVAQIDHLAAWRGTLDDRALTRLHDFGLARNVARDALQNGTYHDVHCWVFTPHSFATLMARTAALDLIGFECANFQETETDDIEFFVAMRRCDATAASVASWRRMADMLGASGAGPQVPGAEGSAADLGPSVPATCSPTAGDGTLARCSAPEISVSHQATRQNIQMVELCEKKPALQNIVDIFAGEWSSQMPAGSGLVSTGLSPLFEDGRITWLEQVLGPVRGMAILELGPLEGAHTYALHNLGARAISAIEANPRAFLRCLAVKEIFGLDRAKFHLGSFIPYLEELSERHDLVVASGVLYHMTEPLRVLNLLCKTADRLFIWSHYYDRQVVQSRVDAHLFAPEAPVRFSGYECGGSVRTYPREALEWTGFSGGGAPHSVWLTRAGLLGFLRQRGFNDIAIGFDHPDHPNGPALAVCARR